MNMLTKDIDVSKKSEKQKRQLLRYLGSPMGELNIWTLKGCIPKWWLFAQKAAAPPQWNSHTVGICVAVKLEERSSPAKGSAWPFPRWRRAGQKVKQLQQDVSLASVNRGIFPATFLWKTQRPGWESRMKGKIINQVVSAKTPAQKR